MPARAAAPMPANEPAQAHAAAPIHFAALPTAPVPAEVVPPEAAQDATVPVVPRVTYRAKKTSPAPSPYKGVFYDNDFSYLEDPGNEHFYLGDALKRRSVGDFMTVDAGGEYRLRHQSEAILDRRDDFLLHRTRLYLNAEIGERFRVYGEAIDAVTDFDDVLPRTTEENRFDALNLFGDWRLLDAPRGQFWFRGGRQELLYGAQRLLSPLDWSSTRRTFDGFKGMWQGEKWDVDAFWTRPVPFDQHLAGGVTDHNFDHPDQSREFMGVWLTRKDLTNHKLDLYYLRLAEFDPGVDFDHHTFGGRMEGSLGLWLWEVEGGYQFGDQGALDHRAGFYTIGGGRKTELPWKPVVWVYYDWASGDGDPTDGVHSTFDQLFPLGHKYLGFMDIVGRQNIEDWNFLVTASPAEKIELALWYHVFKLQQQRDALYNSAGAPIRVDATGAAGSDVGQELDFTIRYVFTPRADLLLGYSRLFPGDFLRATSVGPIGKDFYYGQCTVRF
jgi:hypothetical protein